MFEKIKSLQKYDLNNNDGPNRFKLPSNISFHYCGDGGHNNGPDINQNYPNPLNPTTMKRSIVLLFAWLQAEERHLEKYRHFWYERGFDCITVKTSPLDLLLPTICGRRNAEAVVQFLLQVTPHYDVIVNHSFSVGCFQNVEFYQTVFGTTPELQDTICYPLIANAIRGMVVDSCAFLDEFEKSFSYAITDNPITQLVVQTVGKVYLKTVNYLTDNHFQRAETYGFNNHTNIPGLLLYSKDDPISDYRHNEQLLKAWRDKRTFARAHCWTKSTHVQHYRNYPEEYREQVDNFLENLNLSSLTLPSTATSSSLDTSKMNTKSKTPTKETPTTAINCQ